MEESPPRQSLLSVKEILAWADAHRQRTGRWPLASSGAVVGAVGETWAEINAALRFGRRGLPGDDSLARMLARHRRVSHGGRPLLEEKQIVAWAEAYRGRTGRWPTARSGAIPEASRETWGGIATALWAGNRGLRGGDTLRRLIARHNRRPAAEPDTTSSET
jgi:hypothetical protein